jgi:cold shock CspA family protein
MFYGEIVSIKDGFAFVRVNDPTSEEVGNKFFMHRDTVDKESLVSFDDCRLHDGVAFDVLDDQRGPKALAAMITRREPGARSTGVLKHYNAKGFGFVDVAGELFFCHATECEGFELSADSVGMAVSFEVAPSERGKPACICVRRE